MIRSFAMTCALAAALVVPTMARCEDSFWLFLETAIPCGQAGCAEERRVMGRRLPTSDTAALHQLFGALSARALYEGRPADDPAAPRLCPAGAQPAPGASQPLSPKGAALRGLTAVGLDLAGLAPPPGFHEGFGAALQADFARILAEAGLEVVSPAAAAALPGQPQLKLFFSIVAPLDGCRYSYSVFATLTQTVRLERDASVLLEAGVWSHLGKGDVAGDEAAMLLAVATAFVADWRKANLPDGSQP
jgi:hypothetical protein